MFSEQINVAFMKKYKQIMVLQTTYINNLKVSIIIIVVRKTLKE